jgi:hypothetical protein
VLRAAELVRLLKRIKKKKGDQADGFSYALESNTCSVFAIVTAGV